MKNLIITPILLVILIFFGKSSQAQTNETKLDQIKLMQQLTGTWETTDNKDSINGGEIEQFGSAFLETDYFISGGKKSVISKSIYVYSPKTGKFLGLSVMPNGYYLTSFGSFASENRYLEDIVDNFDPQKVLYKSEMILTVPDGYTYQRLFPNGVKWGPEFKISRIK